MSDVSQGAGWWEATDGKWYPPEEHAEYVDPRPAPPEHSGGQSAGSPTDHAEQVDVAVSKRPRTGLTSLQLGAVVFGSLLAGGLVWSLFRGGDDPAATVISTESAKLSVMDEWRDEHIDAVWSMIESFDVRPRQKTGGGYDLRRFEDDCRSFGSDRTARQNSEALAARRAAPDDVGDAIAAWQINILKQMEIRSETDFDFDPWSELVEESSDLRKTMISKITRP